MTLNKNGRCRPVTPVFYLKSLAPQILTLHLDGPSKVLLLLWRFWIEAVGGRY
jgi:hypothetical protein